MTTFKQVLVDDGLPTVQEEDETTSKDDVQNGSFQFPFFDNGGQLDLSGSKSYSREKIVLSPGRRSMRNESSEGTSFPSYFVDFVTELSPIAKSRESDASHEGMDGASSSHPDHPNSHEGECTAATTNEFLPSATSKATSILALDRSIVEELPHATDPSKTSTNDDLQSARKQVGESSNNFIDKIRNAAHKRKVAVTRSRDSLVAKEEEQLRSIAESKARSQSLLGSVSNFRGNDDENIPPNNVDGCDEFFKNPVMSRSIKTTYGGFGGVGVPKVKKRPTTTPFSPLLGSRRKEKIVIRALQKPTTSASKEIDRTALPRPSSNTSREQRKSTSSNDEGKLSLLRSSSLASDSMKGLQLTDTNVVSSVLSFMARPLPTTSRQCNAGQLGVPKVPKRRVTVPVSPCLGSKRPSKTEAGKPAHSGRGLETVTEADASSRVKAESSKFIARNRKSSSASTVESTELLGLTLLDVSPKKNGGHAASSEQQNVTPRKDSVTPFEPTSTSRAHKRAEYDTIRDHNLQRRRLAEQLRRKEQIKLIHKEIAEMSRELT
jgi:hypothetical protein